VFSNSRIWAQDRTVYHWRVEDFYLKFFNSRNFRFPLNFSYLRIWNWDLKIWGLLFFQSKDLRSESHILPDEGFEMVIWNFPTSKFEIKMSQFSYLRIRFWKINLSKPKNLEVSNTRTKMLRFSKNLCLKTRGCVKVCCVNKKYS